jgi:hypothetical protein
MRFSSIQKFRMMRYIQLAGWSTAARVSGRLKARSQAVWTSSLPASDDPANEQAKQEVGCRFGQRGADPQAGRNEISTRSTSP